MPEAEEKRQLLEFLEVYKSLPALWDVRNPDYSNRVVKENQYDILLQKFRETKPDANKKDLTKRINSLRTTYRRELNRVKNRTNDDEPYKPTLFYFKAFDFLRNTIDEGQLNHPKCSTSVLETSLEPERKKPKISLKCLDPLMITTPKPEKPERPKPQAAASIQSSASSSHQMASVWGLKLAKMERVQRIIAERVINEVMFNGELGFLNFNTCLNNLNDTCAESPHSSSMECKDVITIDPSLIFS